MKYLALFFLTNALILTGCTKCVECEIRLKESQTVIGFVDEFCGTNKKVAAEEERLREDYTCVECIVETGLGTVTSEVQCGDRTYTDSIQAGWEQAAFDIGEEAECIYYRDTANVTCVLN